MVVMEFKILPIATGIGIDTSSGTDGTEGGTAIPGIPGFNPQNTATPEQLARPFLWLLIFQGFFTGLIVGKLSEGSMRQGLKHSFILMVLAIIINTGLKVIVN